MNYAPLYRERRRPNYRPAIGVAVLAAGMAALLAAAPARRAPDAVPERGQGVGDLLHSGGDSAVVRGVLTLRGGDVLAAVRFVRGPRRGTAVYRVSGCPDGGELLDLSTGAARAWERGEPRIFSLIATAACGEPGNTLEES